MCQLIDLFDSSKTVSSTKLHETNSTCLKKRNKMFGANQFRATIEKKFEDNEPPARFDSTREAAIWIQDRAAVEKLKGTYPRRRLNPSGIVSSVLRVLHNEEKKENLQNSSPPSARGARCGAELAGLSGSALAIRVTAYKSHNRRSRWCHSRSRSSTNDR